MKKRLLKQCIGFVVAAMMVGSLVGCTTTPNTGDSAQVEQTTQKPAEQAAAFPVTITDSTGTEVTVEQKPEKIVSLAPSTTEILYFLGVEDHIVGRTKYCTFPETISEVTSVGGTSNPNVEEIVALQPDLVVASTHVSEDVINKLREVGIAVAFLNEQEGFEGTYSAIEAIGKLVGASDVAEQVVADMKQKVADTVAKVEALGDKEKPKVYYTIGFGESDFSAGGNTFIGEIITLAGGINIAQDVEGWSISKEQIAQGDPDMIIMPDNKNMPEDLAKTEFYKDLRAVQEGKLYEINNDMISRQGPRVADAFVEMAKIINPELE
ncbi:MAG: ABC transporter substrate-binding protein [Cellulosilyticaceae bacterium]